MIKSNLFKPKNIRRMTVFLALLAPLVYLFGSQFAALAGAHGEEVLADGNALVAPDYEELMTPENFSYGAFEWENEHGTRLGFSLGYYRLVVNEHINCTFAGSYYGVIQNGNMQANDSNFGLGFSSTYNEDVEFISVNITYKLSFDEYYIFGSEDYYFSFYMVSKAGYNQQIACVLDSAGIMAYLYDGGPDWIQWDFDWSIDESSLYAVYFDDGRNLPEGVEWNDELRSYFVPTVKATQQASYSSTLFGSMFGYDNFLIDIGRNALSDDPKGFAPFGSFWSYLDENVLHLADSDIGLMGYGYMYYAAHVLLFDIGFMLLTFFLSFIQKIGDRFAGGD